MQITRVVIAGSLAVFLILWRFCWLDLRTAIWLQTYLGYWSVLGAFAWFIWELLREARRHDWRAWAREHRAGLLLVLLCGVFLHLQEPHMLKVFNDEPTHVATSLAMHLDRLAVTPGGAHFFDGEMHYVNPVPVVRMYLFSVLLSLLHDVSGYRVENVYVLNGILGVLALGLVYGGGVLLAGKRGGMLGVLLLAGLPLLAQVATSGSYDLLNLVLLLCLWITTLNFIRRPGMGGFELMLATGVLLALARYESILYLILPIGATIYQWAREKRVLLGVRGMLSPLLVWPCFAANFIMLNSKGDFTLSRYRQDGGGFFGWQYLSDNAARAVYYLFDFNLDATSSLLLSLLGCAGLIALLAALGGRWRKPSGMAMETRLTALFFIMVTVMYVLVLSNFWGMPTQSAATRFILPFYTVLALAAAWLVGELCRRRPAAAAWFLAVAAGWMLTIASSSNSRASATARMIFPQSNAWFLDYARHHDDKRTLYVAPSSLFMLSHGYPVVPTAALNAALGRVPLFLEAGLYKEVLVHQILWKNPETGKVDSNLQESLAKDASYEVVAERSFAVNEVSRILRLSHSQPVGKDRRLRAVFTSDRDRTEYYYGLLP